MEYIKKVKRSIFIFSIFWTVLLFMSMRVESTIKFIISGIIIEIILIIYLIFFILRPLELLLKYLNDCRQEVKEIPSNIPLMSEVNQFIEHSVEERTNKNKAQIFDKQTELTALQSQINPHFLYNILECIRGQALIDDNVEIAKMVEALSSFFRYSISRKGNLVTLRDELANIENYMLIQRYRFNNRFSMDIIIDEEDEDAYDFLVPRLIIQPVVENAIFHGLEEKLEGGIVSIEVIITDLDMIITISDNGKGIDREKLEELNNRINAKDIELDDKNTGDQINTGIALPNINRRIRLLFGEDYGVSVYSTLGKGTDVEIIIPANYKREENVDEERTVED